MQNKIKVVDTSNDLRWINEKELKKAYNYVKRKTNKFTEIDKEFITKNPQYLLIFRLVLGMSQKEFTEKLGTTNKQWIRHFEAGRQGFKYSGLIPKCTSLINKQFLEQKILNFEETKKLWKRSQAARKKFYFKPEGSNYKIKKLSKMTIDDFNKYFGYLKKETKNFTHWDPTILVNTPQFITIFRVIVNQSHRSLAKFLNRDPRTVRIHEYREYNLMPQTAKEHIDLFKKLFEDQDLINKDILEESLKNFKRISHYNELEIEIEYILNKLQNRNLNIEKHKNITVNKKTFNIDFIISTNKKPIIAIEVTKLSQTKRISFMYRLTYLDHRFQILKLKYPEIQTFIILQCNKDQENLIKRIIEREVINTNFCLINNEIKDLNKVIKTVI